ncbi:peptidoglycan-binding protein [Loktanella sp. IMCC34160]|uniref:peptidoglycan-binding protein n=1 Tax=Loktanella sp. IMCC34160 TaxID=2510646 RepID=UPI00101CACAE|nr:peptidoglycan-binding protein [Loktanella sp. IMCC34160]RYG89332.1 peptidoglycan-binding protein [Loktanella sp. IMCC34160]
MNVRNSRLAALALATGVLCACDPAVVPEVITPPALQAARVERDASGACFGRDVTPAVIETRTEQVMVSPAVPGPDGTVLSPASFQTVTRQQIVRERQEVLFETICPEDLTPAFIAALQRALAARGFYIGPITALMDLRTRRAIQLYQRRTGHDTAILDIRTARDLGLVAVPRDGGGN